MKNNKLTNDNMKMKNTKLTNDPPDMGWLCLPPHPANDPHK